MRALRGQVALYLLLVILGIAVLVFMNVNAYFAVTAKNRAMNAGDSAALAAAQYQGELLNQVGELDVRHLKLLMPRIVPKGNARSRESRLAEAISLVEQKERITFLGPLKAVQLANEAALKVGGEVNQGLIEMLREHVSEISSIYQENPELYPEPWEGAWKEYAKAFGAAITDDLIAGPDNIDFIDMVSGHYLLMKQFYEAVSGHSWCWFYFYARGLLDSYSSYRDWPPLPRSDDRQRSLRCMNCEVYSLHLASMIGSARELFGDAMIEKITGERIVTIPPNAAEGTFEEDLLDDNTQIWYIYDTNHWRSWWEIDPDGKWKFPVVGRIKEQYDVKGCAAICRVYENFRDILSDDGGEYGESYRDTNWAGAAKPFGTVHGMDGGETVVTAFNNLVVPVDGEWTVKLVPLDTVGGRDMATADEKWIRHVKKHLAPYMESGPEACAAGCKYCAALVQWENASLRIGAREWLKANSSSCIRAQGGGSEAGGTPHGH